MLTTKALSPASPSQPHHSALRRALVAGSLLIGFALTGIKSATAEPAPQAPVMTRVSELSFSYINTGHSAGTQERMVVASGSWFKRRHLTHGAILVQHPAGNFLYDTGLGKQVKSQFSENSWWATQLFEHHAGTPVVEQLAKNEFDSKSLMAIIPSHLHWDHASGIVDFPGVPVWVQQQELEMALAGEAPSFLQSQLNDQQINWKPITLQDKPFLGFTRSLDIFNDGSAVLVDLTGHTAGQVGLYLKLKDDREYLFIGDTTWTLKGIIDKSPRPDLIKFVVNLEYDDIASDRQIQRVHQVMTNRPTLTIVPAHDELSTAELPLYPKLSNSAEPIAQR